MNSAEKEAVLHCLKSMIDEEVCEECPLYGTTGTDHCEKDCVRLAINALSSSEKSNKWIPCSERLPETNDDVLVYDGVDMYVAWYQIKGMWQGWNSRDYSFERDTPIVAWMPLPEPYQSEIQIGQKVGG